MSDQPNINTSSTDKEFGLQELAAYLREHPGVFQQHPELLEIISLSDGRNASSLLERQIAVLKERLLAQKMAQAELFQNARDNEQISNQFSDVISQLISCTNLSEYASEFPRTLRRTFAIDQVAIKTAQSVTRKPSEAQAYEETLRRLNNNRAACDNRWPSSVMQLFFKDDIRSAALVPLYTRADGNTLGVLALGSCDPDRYTHDLGTAHLDKLGLMAGICLRRLQPNSVHASSVKARSHETNA